MAKSSESTGGLLAAKPSADLAGSAGQQPTTALEPVSRKQVTKHTSCASDKQVKAAATADCVQQADAAAEAEHTQQTSAPAAPAIAQPAQIKTASAHRRPASAQMAAAAVDFIHSVQPSSLPRSVLPQQPQASLTNASAQKLQAGPTPAAAQLASPLAASDSAKLTNSCTQQGSAPDSGDDDDDDASDSDYQKAGVFDSNTCEPSTPEETLQWGCELYKETIRRWQGKCKELDPYIMATEQRVSSSSQVAGSRGGAQGAKLSKLAELQAESAVLEQEAAWWRDRFRALQSRASAPGKAVMGKAGPPGQHTGATKVSILFTSACHMAVHMHQWHLLGALLSQMHLSTIYHKAV